MIAYPGSHARLKRSLWCSIAKFEGLNLADGMDVLLFCLLCFV
jgi:hypothetical protein